MRTAATRHANDRARRCAGCAWHRLVAVVLALAIGAGGGRGWARAEDDPPPPAMLAPLEALVLPVKKTISVLPPFLANTDLKVHFRTYYFNRTRPDDTQNEAWAFGGWVSYRSGWLLDVFSMGAALYGSAPLYAPADKDGTLLLKPGQEGYFVPGEAWGALRHRDYALLTGYRQLVDQTYINPRDNRMTPDTFQGVTLRGNVEWFQYLGGFLWKIKPRNADEFISMSEQAGAIGSNDGVGLFGVVLTPLNGLRIDSSNQYGVNTFNTFYGEADYRRPLDDDWTLRLGAQFTDQRAVGDALLRPADGKYWITRTGGARVQFIYRQFTLTGAFSITGSGNNIQSPWGRFPGYLYVIDQEFNRAHERAVLVGAAYDFAKLVRGLSANANVERGWDAIDPLTRRTLPNQTEYNVTADYRPPFNVPILQGLRFRARAAILDQQDAKTLGYQFRLIIDWERDLIR